MDTIGKQRCPSRAALAAYCAGTLPVEEIESLAAHVEVCPQCESALDTIDERTADGVWKLHSSELIDALLADPQLDRLRRRAKAPGFREATMRNGQVTETWRDGWDSTPVRDEELGEPRLPERIGKYFVVSRLGAGGFSNVYLAQDPDTDRKVAIKVPRPEKLSSEEAIENFLAEARTAAAFVHPGIVRTYDFGRLEEGGCYVVMEYIEGCNLKQLIQSQRLSHDRAAEIIAEVAEILEHAHQRQIYHRDIKPGNILIDAAGRPHVSDFGLAIHETDRWKHRDELAGTHVYMSPEQARRESQYVDGRTDIWSLGVVFYQLLTNSFPFTAETKSEVLDEILMREPPPPRSLDATIPAELERICLRCLTKDVRQRYATGGDLGRELRVYSRRRRWRRFGTRVAAAAALLLLGGAIALFSIGREGPVPPAPAPAPPAANASLPPVLVNSLGMELQLIQPGTFTMGSRNSEADRGPDEIPHMVHISRPFYIGRYEVTEAQYAEVLGREAPPGDLPAAGVSWNDAQQFCQALNQLPAEQKQGRRYRLPTEAEWEYCCRGGTNTAFAFGEQLTLVQASILSRRLDADSLRQETHGPAPVGSFPPNALGLYDMHGNVWEWCNDRYGPYDEASLIDPLGPAEGNNRVIRGGCWHSAASECRSANRQQMAPDKRDDQFGFRVVCEKLATP